MSIGEKSGVRRKGYAQRTSHDDASEGDEDEGTAGMFEDGNDKMEETSESEAEEAAAKEKKEQTKQKEKKVKGCRELQDLLEGVRSHASHSAMQCHASSVHKSTRSQERVDWHLDIEPCMQSAWTLSRLASFGCSGHSESTWSSSSSRMMTDKDSGNQQTVAKKAQNSSKQLSSLTSSSAQDVRKPVDSSTEVRLLVCACHRGCLCFVESVAG